MADDDEEYISSSEETEESWTQLPLSETLYQSLLLQRLRYLSHKYNTCVFMDIISINNLKQMILHCSRDILKNRNKEESQEEKTRELDIDIFAKESYDTLCEFGYTHVDPDAWYSLIYILCERGEMKNLFCNT